VLEQSRIGDPATASYGRTRSYRKDYLDATYVRFADESIRLWSEFERDTGAEVLVRCGCMNIAAASVTPDMDSTYALRSLAEHKADIFEQVDITGIEREGRLLRVSTNRGHFRTGALVITAGHGSNRVLSQLPGAPWKYR
jgi:glycine/D-amino acid oxidase-like deaminating enzyme